MAEKKNALKRSIDFPDVEKEIIRIELERSRLSREKGLILLNKSVFLYFTFIFVGVLGLINGYLDSDTLSFIILMGIVALIVGTAPYIIAAGKEQKILTRILEDLTKRSEMVKKK